MHGPTTATMRDGSAPRACMAVTVEWMTPPSAPFQPAWAAPMTPASASANRTGAQSAVRTVSTGPFTPATTASPSGRSPAQPLSATRATAEWT
ncbi:hypothetical protein D3C73_1247340 [compost metagenome]